MKIASSILLLSLRLSWQALGDTVDVFPLRPGLSYEYEYNYSYGLYYVGGFDGGIVDSGYVRCIVTDSVMLGDTVISWTIRHITNLLHRYIGPSWPDTSYWSVDSSTFELREHLGGMHRLVTPIIQYVQTWQFSPNDSVFRYATSPTVLVALQWSSPPPLGGDGTDSLWFSDANGFFKRRTFGRTFDGFHSWALTTLDVTLLEGPTLDIHDGNSSPMLATLEQNYPNPFNPTTSISFTLVESADIVLKIYDVLGREIETIADHAYTPGTHTIIFNGSKLSSGLYFYRLQSGTHHKTRKMVLQR